MPFRTPSEHVGDWQTFPAHTALEQSAATRQPWLKWQHGYGLIASSGAYSNALYQGIAPSVRLIVLKALDQNGQGYLAWSWGPFDCAGDPALLATDLVDYLVRKGVPFRQAHDRVGAVVALAEARGKPLNRLTPEELQSVDGNFAADALEVFDLKRAMAQRNAIGAPGTKEVRQQLRRWRRVLGA